MHILTNTLVAQYTYMWYRKENIIMNENMKNDDEQINYHFFWDTLIGDILIEINVVHSFFDLHFLAKSL